MPRPFGMSLSRVAVVAVLVCAMVLLGGCSQAPPEKRAASMHMAVLHPEAPFTRAPYLTVDVGKLDKSAILVVALDPVFSPDIAGQEPLPTNGFQSVPGNYAAVRVVPAAGEYRFDLNPDYLSAATASTAGHTFTGWRVSVLLVNKLRLMSLVGPKRTGPSVDVTPGQLPRSGSVMLVAEGTKAVQSKDPLLKDAELFQVKGLKGNAVIAGSLPWAFFPASGVVDELRFAHE